jgi:hypothetical protein
MKGGSPASNHVMELVSTPIRVDGMMVVPMKGGSGASNNVMSLVQPVCACDPNLPPAAGKMAGTVTDFYLSSGGGKKTKKNNRGGKVNRPKKARSLKKGGSVPYYLSMKGLCGDCGGVKLIDAFPAASKMSGGGKKRSMKGGSGWLMVHNSRSANAMPVDQFRAFTQSEQFVAGGQNPSCVFNGPMFK